MKKSIWIFLLAVLLPGFVLGWLALRSAEEQQIIFERRTAELYQKETESLAATAREAVESERRAFGDIVHRLLAKGDAEALAQDFTNTLMDAWPRKAVGFVLGPEGRMLSPTTTMAAKNAEWREFLWNNGSFLCSTQPAVVYPVSIENKVAYAQSRGRSLSYDGKPAVTMGREPEQTVLAQKQPQSVQTPPLAVKSPIPAREPALALKGRAEAAEAERHREQVVLDPASRQTEAPMRQAAAVPVRRELPREQTETNKQETEKLVRVDELAKDSAGLRGRGAATREQNADVQDPVRRTQTQAAAPIRLEMAPASAAPKPEAASAVPPLPAPEIKPDDALPRPTPYQERSQVARSDGGFGAPARPAAVPAAPGPASEPLAAVPSGATAEKKLAKASPAKQEPAGLGVQRESEFSTSSEKLVVERKQEEVGGRTRRVLSPITSVQQQAQRQAEPSEQISAAGMLGNSVQFPAQSFGRAPDAYNRMVEPQQTINPATANWSAVLPATADFRALTANSVEGMLARFVQDKLDLIFWIRPPEAPEMVFGCLVDANDLAPLWNELFANRAPEAGSERPPYVLALLDDKARPVTTMPAGVTGREWKRPFVASEVGEVLPHWEAALYLATPTAMADTARGLRRTLSFTIAAAIALIALGGWLVVADVRRQLALAQQKTDFVSNVSHELKMPLTSIRMFAELMHDRPQPVDKQGQYLRIITVEAERLTRLINNVLDFAKLERKQKRFDKKPLDLCELITRVWEGHDIHLRDAGFATRWEATPGPYPVLGDEDALAQVLVNLLSNAEKYSQEKKEVELVTWVEKDWINVSVLDRGMGVPDGEERKIFEAFYRAHDSLSSGIQGSGLGLTLAQRIAHEHHGEITFERRQGGGSRFTLRLPLVRETAATNVDSERANAGDVT